MTEEKRREYVVVEAAETTDVHKRLNELARDGYEVVAVTPAGTDDKGRAWTMWTLRLRREQWAATVEATLMDVQRRLEALEAWRLEAESQLAQGVCSGEDCGAIQRDEEGE